MKQFLLLLTLATLLSCNGDGDPGDKDTDSTSNESIENNQPKMKVDSLPSLDTVATKPVTFRVGPCEMTAEEATAMIHHFRTQAALCMKAIEMMEPKPGYASKVYAIGDEINRNREAWNNKAAAELVVNIQTALR